MEKTPMYAVVTPPHPCKRQWVAWAATGVSIIALVVACVTAAVAVQQVDRVTELEDRMLEMQSHMEEILKFTLSSHDYLEYDEGADDSQLGPYEELTVQRVVRKKREADADDSAKASVPIYDQAYGVDLKGRSNSEGLRLYESLLATRGEGDPTSAEVTFESTDSPIKPHHRVSNLWVPKKHRQRYPSASGPQLSSRPYVAHDDDDDEDDNIINRQTRRRAVMERTSRVKSLHGSGRRVRMRKKTRVQSNQNPVPVLFRESLVKATSRHNGYTARNSVVPKPARVSQPARVPQPARIPQPQTTVVEVQQRPETLKRNPSSRIIDGRRTIVRTKKNKKKRPGRNERRRRRARSVVTVAHFVASTTNRTTRHGSSGRQVHHEWTPAAWMEQLALNRKYSLSNGVVTVKEPGLYYLYAQVLYEPGRFATGYQILVDGIPVMECSLAPTQPSHSCHTAAATYLPRNAKVYVRDLEHHTTAVRRPENSFFGLMRLMDAPNPAEELLLG